MTEDEIYDKIETMRRKNRVEVQYGESSTRYIIKAVIVFILLFGSWFYYTH